MRTPQPGKRSQKHKQRELQAVKRVSRISDPQNEVNWGPLQPSWVRSQPRHEQLQLGSSRAGAVLTPRKGEWMFPPLPFLQGMARADAVVDKYINPKYVKKE